MHKLLDENEKPLCDVALSVVTQPTDRANPGEATIEGPDDVLAALSLGQTDCLMSINGKLHHVVITGANVNNPGRTKAEIAFWPKS